MPLDYIRDPEKIYQQSFAIVKDETDLSQFPADQHPLITRLIHACGMPDITDELCLSNNLMTTAQTALDNGAKILCDCEMTAAGIIKRNLPRHTKIITTLNDAATPTLAKQIQNTRSAAAVELWQPHIAGAIIAIGNAPTALFHLLELLAEWQEKPACILGFPVGFVGAAESKIALANNPFNIPFATLHGRRGGTAITAAAVNGLVSGLGV